jgi:hypothetical protein
MIFSLYNAAETAIKIQIEREPKTRTSAEAGYARWVIS